MAVSILNTGGDDGIYADALLKKRLAFSACRGRVPAFFGLQLGVCGGRGVGGPRLVEVDDRVG